MGIFRIGDMSPLKLLIPLRSSDSSSRQKRVPAATDTRDIDTHKLKLWNDFASQVANQLAPKPALINDDADAKKHPELRTFFSAHPDIREAMEANPGNYVAIPPRPGE
jgi:hypothetical protein